METTLVLVKPDGVQRGAHRFNIIARFEAKGLQIVGLKLLSPARVRCSRSTTRSTRRRPFFESLLSVHELRPRRRASPPEGEGAIGVVRNLVGRDERRRGRARPRSRGDFGMSKSFNLVHASDGADTAAFELGALVSPRARSTTSLDNLRLGERPRRVVVAEACAG